MSISITHCLIHTSAGICGIMLSVSSFSNGVGTPLYSLGSGKSLAKSTGDVDMGRDKKR